MQYTGIITGDSVSQDGLPKHKETTIQKIQYKFGSCSWSVGMLELIKQAFCRPPYSTVEWLASRQTQFLHASSQQANSEPGGCEGRVQGNKARSGIQNPEITRVKHRARGCGCCSGARTAAGGEKGRGGDDSTPRSKWPHV